MLVNKMRNLQLFTFHLWKYCNKKSILGSLRYWKQCKRWKELFRIVGDVESQRYGAE